MISAPVFTPPRRALDSRGFPAPREGLAVRGILFGLLLVMPFWLVLGLIVVLAL